MSSLIRGARLDSENRVLDQLHHREFLLSDDESMNAIDTDILQNTELAQDDTDWSLNGNGLSPAMSADTSAPMDEFQSPQPGPPQVTYGEFRRQFDDELMQLRRDAEKEGYEQGKKSGLEAAASEYREQIDQMSMLLTGMRKALEAEIDGVTDIGAEIVFEAVLRILGRNYLERDGVIAVVREVIRHAKDQSRLVLRVSPADFSLLENGRELLVEGWNSQQVDIIADDRVELGGCLLESPAGNLDGRLEVQLQQLRETLLNARQRRSESVLES